MTAETLFVHSALGLGGAESLRFTLLREFQRQGVACRVCLFRNEGALVEPVRELGVPVDVLNVSGKLHSPRTTWKLSRYLRKTKPGVIHGGQFLTNMHTTAAAKIAGVGPVIIEEHGHYKWKRWYHRLIDRHVCARADHVVCCSDSVRRFAQKILRLPDRAFSVIHNCIDLPRFEFDQRQSRAAIRKELGIAEDEFLFGNVGTLRREKGHDVLLQAWKMRQTTAETREKLLLVGDGPLRNWIREQTAGDSSVLMIGSRSDVPEVLTALDAFVFPSINEGLGIALIEAMASGLPCIASNTGGIPEIIRDGVTGILVPDGNAGFLAEQLTRIRRDSRLRSVLSTGGRDYALTRHTPTAYFEELQRLHHALQAG